MSHEIARESDRVRENLTEIYNTTRYGMGRRVLGRVRRWMDGYYNTFWPGRQTLNAIFVDKYERARRGTVLGVLSGVRGKGTGYR